MTAHANAARSPQSARYWFQVGRQAIRNGQRADAVRALRQAVAADPYDADSLLWLAGMSEDPRESLRLLARALALNPRNEAAHEGIRWARRRLLGDARAPAWRAMQRAGLEPAARGIDSVAAGPAASAFPAPVREERHSRQQTYERLALLARITIVASLTLTVLLSAATAWLLLQPVPEPGVTLVAAASAEAAEVAPLELPEARPPAQPRPFNRAEVYAARVAALTRQVDVTWAEQDWDQSALLLAQALAFQPGDPMLTRKLVAAYFNGAVAAINDGDLDGALSLFDEALALAPADPQIQAERDTLAGYLRGLSLYNQGNWSASAQTLRKVYASDAGYLDTRGLLYRAYYFQGLDFKQAQDWQNALTAFQTALAIDDSGDEARAELSATQTTIQNLRPGALGEKWIEVNLTTQRFRALQGQTVVYAFVTSTGENGRETQPGRYQVLDKIPNAYSRFWNLWMPYWMGIYWAGSSENGIHALPILSSGQTLWAGYLGSRVSFGCVILDTSAAKLIYDWADIGTTVVVHY